MRALYEQPELLAAAIRLRDRADTCITVPVPSAQRASHESLRQRLATAHAEIDRLRAENAALRDQVARALGEQRTRR